LAAQAAARQAPDQVDGVAHACTHWMAIELSVIVGFAAAFPQKKDIVVYFIKKCYTLRNFLAGWFGLRQIFFILIDWNKLLRA
jgi:hypothetical protein